ncbi:MAG: N-acyl homoserine lactonase family protein, partial [Pseudooceanicola nanhaiensis]
MIEDYEVYAVQYGTIAERRASENFLGGDPHDAAPMPLNYYVWLIRNADRVILVDTGFNAERAARR